VATIDELNDSVSPNAGGFAPEGARAEWNYDVAGDDFRAKCLEIIGYTRRLGDGRLDRQIPQTHPQIPWLMATSIASFRGVGLRDEENASFAVLADSEAADDLPAVTDTYMQYARYDVRVLFEAPAFNLRTNDDIGLTETGDWYDDLGDRQIYRYAPEWLRFTDAPRHDDSEFVQFKQGQMLFRSTLAGAASGKASPDGAAFPGVVRIGAPKQTMLMTWLRVPESYILSADSWLARLVYRVNQKPWLDFLPGQALYRGYKILRRSTPPFPDELEGFPGVFSSEKLVDVELNIGICRFACDDAPEPTNKNFVANGWNLFHWAGDRRPHYVTSLGIDLGGTLPPADQEALRVPVYRSAPLELLFTDPDIQNPIGILNVGG
jgi:hypothetical protein